MEGVHVDETSAKPMQLIRPRAWQKTTINYMKKPMLIALLLLFNAALSTSIVQAAVRVEVGPGLPGGVPVYARTDFFLHDEEWAAIPFYRSPECVPEDFNLLNFFDVPGVFACPLTVAGFEIWENGPPPIDPAPIFSNLRGLGAVPVYFVSWPELQAAIADGELTMSELESLDSLQIGYASFFEELLHPFPEAHHPNLSLIAHGLLLDGRSFHFEVTDSLQEHGQNVGSRVKSFSLIFK